MMPLPTYDPAVEAPAPIFDRDTVAYWEAAARGELAVPRCGGCGIWIWQPKPVCPRCHGDDIAWHTVEGRGEVVTWTVIHPPVLAPFQGRTPFVLLLVELPALSAAGAPVRMTGQLVGDDAELLTTDGTAEGLDFGSPAEVRFQRRAQYTLPVWTLVGESPAGKSPAGETS